jgi:hypothetical protein
MSSSSTTGLIERLPYALCQTPRRYDGERRHELPAYPLPHNIEHLGCHDRLGNGTPV